MEDEVIEEGGIALLAEAPAPVVSYEPIVWVEDQEPYLDPDNLNHIEKGIADTVAAINAAAADIFAMKAEIETVRDSLSRLSVRGLNRVDLYQNSSGQGVIQLFANDGGVYNFAVDRGGSFSSGYSTV